MALHLVTGGSGFLGNLIARRLLERGERVRILDVWSDPTRPPEIELVEADVCDRAALARALEGVEVVHHDAALVPLTKSGTEFWRVNVDGSRIAAEEAVRAGVQHFIHVSSSAIFGAPRSCPVTRDTPTRPVEAYGRSKLAGEESVKEVCGAAGLPLVVIRPRTILGEGRLGIFQILFEWIRENRNVYVIGSGNVDFQFVHAHDLMDAYLLVLEQGVTGDFNVGTDRYGTLRACLEDLVRHAGSTARVKSLPAWAAIPTLRALDVLGLSPLAPWHYLTYHKAFAFDVQPLLDLGWKPRYSNEEMVRESFDWFVAHPPAPKSEDGTASAHRKPVAQKILGLIKRLS